MLGGVTPELGVGTAVNPSVEPATRSCCSIRHRPGYAAHTAPRCRNLSAQSAHRVGPQTLQRDRQGACPPFQSLERVRLVFSAQTPFTSDPVPTPRWAPKVVSGTDDARTCFGSIVNTAWDASEDADRRVPASPSAVDSLSASRCTIYSDEPNCRGSGGKTITTT
jgi:hypothetical protein